MPTLYTCEKCNPPSPPKPKPSQKKHSPPNKKKFNFKKSYLFDFSLKTFNIKSRVL